MPKVGSQDAATAMRSTTFQVSVLRCKQTGQVLFLEAGKDFVDTILSFLLLPVGTIIHMLSNGPVQVKPLGGISGIFESVKNLDCSLLHVDKQTLVAPKPAVLSTCRSTGLLQGALEATNTPSPSKKKLNLPQLYRCTDLRELEEAIVGDEDPVEEATCSSGQGFMRENITYMITDSLEIMPSTTIRSIKVLNKLKVATLADLESSDITVSIKEVLQLLQSAMTSSSCLNDVFGKK